MVDSDTDSAASSTGQPAPAASSSTADLAKLLADLLRVQGSSTASTTKPVAPTIGGIVTKAGHQLAWTGGRPKIDWSGLDPKAKQTPAETTQLRNEYHSVAYKQDQARIEGLSEKFDKGSDLEVFITKVWKHLERHGLDSITYLPDPANPTVDMSSVVEMHARFTLDHVRAFIGSQWTKYDNYDLSNDSAAKEFLMNSVSAEIYKELHLACEKEDSFPVTFMQFMKIVRTVTIEHITNVKERIKARRPQQYAGQDIAQMAMDFKTDAIELEKSGHYDHILTVNMLDAFLSAGGREAEQFRFPLRYLRDRLGKKVLSVAHLSKQEADKIMVQEGLTFRQICTEATDSYRTRVANGDWGPARNNPDSKKPPNNFGMMADSNANWTPAQINALIQAAANGNGKDITCFSCGEAGHFARDCPKKKPGNKKAMNNKHGSGKKNLKPSQKSWKKTPPGPKESQKKTIDGRDWHWCSHCGRWSTTHGTDGHTNDLSRKPEGPSVNSLSIQEFAVWNFEVDFDTPICSAVAWLIAGSKFLLMALGLASVLPRLLWIIGPVFGAFATLLSAVFAWMHTNPVLSMFGLQWLTLLLLLLAIRYFPAMILPAPRPAPPPDELPRIYRRKGANFTKKVRRRFTRMLFSQRSPTSPAPGNPRHYHQRRAALERNPIERRFHSQATELLDRMQAFERSIRFQRAKLYAEGGKHRAWNSSRPPNFKRRKHTTRHAAPGLTVSQVQTVTSPLAQAYINNTSLPSYLLNAADALKAAFVAPQNHPIKQADRHPVIWDSGASISISPDRNDFVGPLESPPFGMKLQGIAKNLRVEGIGHVAWSFIDVTGRLRTLKVKALLVPKASVRLLSISSLLAKYPDESVDMTAHHLLLSGAGNSTGGPPCNPIEVLVDPTNNLPTATAYASDIAPRVAMAMNASISATIRANHNISPAEKELLRWHFRLGHLSFRKIQFLMRTGVLAHSEGARRLQSNASKLTRAPMCAACQYGKQKRRPTPGKRSSVVKDRAGVMKNGDLFPGQRISVDHFICSTRGRLSNTHGKEHEDKQYVGGAIFVDHASGYLHVEPQVHLNTHETLQAKVNFEKHCRDLGVLPQSYQSDNASVFTSDEYARHLETFQQIQTFAGVGAHHHNSVAERSIHTVVSIARTMMLHSAIHWPEVADAKLWNLAIQHAVFLYNHMPNESTGLSPHDLFTKSRWPHSRFHDIHVWGCPVYVLDKTLADGKKLPKWRARSERAMYVGMSQYHASSVPLVLNLDTGRITPQYHVVFDDWFATIGSDPDKLPLIGSNEWQHLFGDTEYQYPFDDDDRSHEAEDAAHDDTPSHQGRTEAAFDSNARSEPLPVVPQAAERPSSSISAPEPLSTLPDEPLPTPLQREQSLSQREPSPPPMLQREDQTSQNSPNRGPDTSVTPTNASGTPPPLPAAPAASLSNKKTSHDWLVVKSKSRQAVLSPKTAPAPLSKPVQLNTSPRRSTRDRKAPSRLGFDGSQGYGYLSLSLEPTCNHLRHTFINPFAHKARASKDPDTFSYHEAMKDTDREKFLEAARSEIKSLEGMDCWDEVPVSDAKSKIIPGTFVFRRKRSPDGQIKKYKGRFCVRGDLQEDNGDNFAPVVAWPTTRTVLILSILWGWTTCAVDFSNAFVHAHLKDPIWIRLPQGFTSASGPDTCLRLKRSLYGTNFAPKLWYETASQALMNLGLKRSELDPCLFLKTDMMVVLYVDDAIICAKNEALADKLVDDLRAMHFTLTREGTFAEYLGIKFEKRSDGSYLLTQRGLTEKIIEATGLNDANPNWMPTTQLALGTDPDGSAMKENWKYSSIVGMLLYLSSNTRPDIAFAVSQVCRFSSNPKQSHASAVKTIVRYLIRTRDKGMLLSPSQGPLTFDHFVDADFAGLHGREEDFNPNAARSRMGFIIFLNNCAVFWKSQLLSHICLSTLEAEYSSLSISLRTLIPLRRLLDEILATLNPTDSVTARVQANVFEDNDGALLLARNHQITNRTKYFLVKWHWFWSVASDFVLSRVASKDQRADFLTKGLPRDDFENNRRSTMGW